MHENGCMPDGDGFPIESNSVSPSIDPSERNFAPNALEPRSAPSQTLHGLFEAQAQRTPQWVAVLCDDQKITYAELELRANSLAQHLISSGVGRESLVGLYVERSLDLAVGLLAILKSGGAYVPLDPDYPLDRLTFMLADTGVTFALTQRRLVASLPRSLADYLCIDEFQGESSVVASSGHDTEPSGTDLAYVMYTSGSTGQPKGVMIEHAAVVNTILDINCRFQVGPTDRVLASSSFGFDLSVYDMFGLWAAGGSVVIPEPDAARSAAHWSALRASTKLRSGIQFRLHWKCYSPSLALHR